MTAPKIVPEVAELTEPYWAAARRGFIALQRCLDCGLVWHPPLPTCPDGVGHRIEWIEASGVGTLHSYTSVRHAAHPALTQHLPYVVALVDLAEGLRIICTLLDAEEDQLTMALPVVISLGPTPGGLSLPVARLLDTAAAADQAHRA